jgi:peptide/nickel transport system permease protein
MTRFFLHRMLAGLVALAVASVVVFSLLFLSPGDPATSLAGPSANPETVAAIRADLGLDRPLVSQYLDWLRQLLSGNLGKSYVMNRPVSELIDQRLGSTLQLTVAAAVVMILLGMAMGVVLATGKSRAVRNVMDHLSTLALALPPFVSGFILIFLFAVVWRVLPSGGDAPLLAEGGDGLRLLILPSIAIALPSVPVIARLLATEMRRSQDREFVLTALAKGAGRRRITWRHVVPNSLGPPVVELSIRIGHLLGGAVVAEAIFNRAGLGSLLVQAVQDRDIRLAQGLLMLAIAAVIIVQLIAEVLLARIDPRVRLEGTS